MSDLNEQNIIEKVISLRNETDRISQKLLDYTVKKREALRNLTSSQDKIRRIKENLEKIKTNNYFETDQILNIKKELTDTKKKILLSKNMINNYNQFTESERSNINRILKETTKTKKKILNKMSLKPEERRKYEQPYGISSDIIRKINSNIVQKKKRGLIGISKQERQQIINKINPSLKKIEIIEEELKNIPIVEKSKEPVITPEILKQRVRTNRPYANFQTLDFNVMISNIRDSPIYREVLKDQLEIYEMWRKPENITTEQWEVIQQKKEIKIKDKVRYFLFNEPKKDYEKDFDDLLKNYSVFYGEGNEVLTTQNLETQNRKIEIKRNYEGDVNKGIPSIISQLNTDDGMLNVLDKRIDNGFNECIKKGELSERRKFYVNTLSDETINQIQIFLKNEKEKEKKIKNSLNSIINFIDHLKRENKINENQYNELLYTIKKKKKEFISEKIRIDKNNKNYSDSPENCSFQNNINPEYLKQTEEMIQKYIKPQGKKAVLLGTLNTLTKFLNCKGFFHGLLSITPFEHIKPGELPCHKYIMYTLFYNRLYIAFALAKNMDIPIVICLRYSNQTNFNNKNPKNLTLKYLPPIKKNTFLSNNNNKKFIGIIEIPYTYTIKANKRKNGKSNEGDLNIRYNKYIFIFENTTTSSYIHYGISTHYDLFNENMELIIYGTTKIRKTILYDEIGELYWMSKKFKKDLRIYFYRDPDIPMFIYVSTRPNLDDKELYPSYNLKKVLIDKWYQQYQNKKHKFFNEQFMLFNENKKNLIKQKKIEKKNTIENFANNYLLITSSIKK